MGWDEAQKEREKRTATDSSTPALPPQHCKQGNKFDHLKSTDVAWGSETAAAAALDPGRTLVDRRQTSKQ